MMRPAAWLVVALALVPSVASAQPAPGLNTGTRVRLWTVANAEPVIGTIVHQNGSALTVSVRGLANPAVVPRDTITRLDVGRRRSTGRSALIGAAIGAASGLLIGLAAGDDQQGFIRFTAGQKALIFGTVTTPIGALIGWAVGPGEDRWTTMANPLKSSRVVTTPQISARFSVRF